MSTWPNHYEDYVHRVCSRCVLHVKPVFSTLNLCSHCVLIVLLSGELAELVTKARPSLSLPPNKEGENNPVVHVFVFGM